MNTPLRWASAHPIQTILFTFAFTLLASLMAVNDDLLPYGLIAFGVLQVLFGISMWRHARKLIPILLVLACLGNRAKAEEPKQLAGIGVGVVVVCAGGYCVYKLVKFCQKKFPPKDTNANPGFVAGGEYGAAYEYSSPGSCFESASALDEPMTFSLEVRVGGGSPTMTASSGNDQTWQEFQSEMAGHGLNLTGHVSWQPVFARNGAPCEAAEVPLSFEQFTGRVIHTGTDIKRVTVERSVDLTTWAPLMVTDVPNGMALRVVDTTREGQMFYRITTR